MITLVVCPWPNAVEHVLLIPHYWPMEELLRTNNPVTVSFAQSLLKEDGITHFVADEHMSIVDGSLGILPRRIMVDTDSIIRARKLMQDAGLGCELPEKPIRDIV